MLPLTSSRTGGGPAGFTGPAGAGKIIVAPAGAVAATGVVAGAEVDVAAGGFVDATVGAFFAMLGCGAGVAPLGVAVAVGAGDVAALLADGAGAVPDVEDLLAGAEVVAVSEGAGGLLAAGAGAGATAVSVFAGFGCDGTGDFSAAGSGLFSLMGLEGASDILMVAT